MRTYVGYFRVSTARQGQSGLGLDAQRSAVTAHLEQQGGTLLCEFTEVETGKGASPLDRRPELRAALALCRRTGATLVIAKLDRLARNVHFVSGLLESGVEFVAADMPQATKTMLQIYSAMAEWERDQISARTKAALAAAKARGVRLGVTGPSNLRRNIEERKAAAVAFAERLRGQVAGFQLRGLSQRQMVTELNTLGIAAPAGGTWRLSQLQRLLSLQAECP